ncbi:MAG: hypothetical protein ACRCZK_00970 [Oscillospiraceae bacterium]
MKKFLIIALTLAMSFTLLYTPSLALANEKIYNSNMAVYQSLEEWETSENTDSGIIRIQNNKSRYQGGYIEYVKSGTRFNNNVRVGYHPSFNSFNYWDGYYFSNKKSNEKFNVSLSASIGLVSVNVLVKKRGNSGTFKKANGNRRSRPWVRADITTNLYDINYYNEYGRLTNVIKNGYKTTKTSDVQIFIGYI